MSDRFTLKFRDTLGSPARKRHFNERVFSLISSEYDFITRALSLWRDAAWKRVMIGLLPERNSPCCVDLACGTGDICSLLSHRYPNGLVVGVDIAAPMLTIARSRHRARRICFLRQDMGNLGFEDCSIDIVTGSYALRNASDLDIALKEIQRVLKPGGRAVFLDFSKSPRSASRAIGYWVLKVWGGFWGFVLHGNPEVYGYIAESLRIFPDRVELRRAMKSRGLSVVASRLFFFGMIELIVAERVAEDQEQAKAEDRVMRESIPCRRPAIPFESRC